MPVCSKCKQEKQDNQFFTDKRHKTGRYSQCKECWSDSQKIWRINNLEKAKASCEKWEDSHKEQRKEQHQLYYLVNKENILEKNKLWSKNNPEKAKALSKKHSAKHRSSLKGHLNDCMSSNIYIALKGNKGGRRWEDLVGYTVDQLKQHLERRFRVGMSWDNYGTYWEIDHHVPVVVFNYEHPEDIDFRLCWSLKNLQPLEKTKNRRKSSKIEKPFQPSLAIGMGR